jgi:hypothetical protein
MQELVRCHNDLDEFLRCLTAVLKPFLQYSARSANATKALSNWEQKSQHLLAEIIKYESYVESLRLAMNLRLKKRGEKVLEKALIVAPEDEYEDNIPVTSSPGGGGSANGGGRTPAPGKGIQHEETIQETEEPWTPGPLSGFTNAVHRRETAGDE